MKEKASYSRMKMPTVGGFVMAGKKGMKHYSEAVRMHLEEDITTPEIMQKFGIATPRCIRSVVRRYRNEGTIGKNT